MIDAKHFGPLFATSRGKSYQQGKERCFYCGSPCGTKNRSETFVKDSFTSRDTVCGGNYVCEGCVCALDERATITLPSGDVRCNQKTRCYSWVFNAESSTAATKADRKWLLDRCLSPPEPPFVICLSDSGQKHLLYRSCVCFSQDIVTVTLEAQSITFSVKELTDRYSLTVAMAAAIGKPGLAEPLSHRQQMTAIEFHETGEYLSRWMHVAQEPLSHLALWFCPGKKESIIEHDQRLAIAG